MRLRRVAGQRLKAELAPSSSGPKVQRLAPFTTPWRTLQIAASAAGLYMSDLILNLNEPNRLGDVSWFKPGKYLGIWWELHLDRSTWSSGPRHGATTDNARRYIDFAANKVSAACSSRVGTSAGMATGMATAGPSISSKPIPISISQRWPLMRGARACI